MESDEHRHELRARRSRDELLCQLRLLTHQLSQPITILRGSVELALMGTPDQAECRKTLEQSLQQIDRIVQILFALRELLEKESSPETRPPTAGYGSQPA